MRIATPGRNEPCWCESGRKFKKCHGSPAPPDTPPQIISDRINKKHFATGHCLFPASAECKRTIRSHTVQRQGLLKRIVDGENRVSCLHLNMDRLPPHWEEKKVGWKKASTFPGFCSVHDQRVFAPIESEPFEFRPEQAFLLGYRAVCHELQRKTALAATYPQTAALLKFQLEQVPPHVDHYFRSALVATDELQEQKNRLDQIFAAQAWNDWSFCALVFRGPVEVVAAGSTTPEFDFRGHRLQDIRDLYRSPENLTVGMTGLSADRFCVVLGWEKTTQRAEMLVNSLLSMPCEKISSYVLQYLFVQLENVFFRPGWWSALSESSKLLLRKHAERLSEASPPSYSPIPLVSWTFQQAIESR